MLGPCFLVPVARYRDEPATAASDEIVRSTSSDFSCCLGKAIMDGTSHACQTIRFLFHWSNQLEIQSCGAAGEVTGSCHLIRVAGKQVLLDCGLIQGRAKDEARNRDPFPFDPASLDAVILSHAHIDHSGRLPLLIKGGFDGPIYTHSASADLCDTLLKDSAHLNFKNTQWENKHRKRRGKAPLEPLYVREDAERAPLRPHDVRPRWHSA